MGFNLDDYEPVASRFARFIEWAATTEHFFAVQSEMLSAPGADICVFKTSILCDGVVVATGHAEEIRNAGNVNRTSHVENCETSSLGRCLAGFPMHNFAGSDYTKRPSREEMAKVSRTSNGPARETGTDPRWPSVTVSQPANLASDKQKNMIRAICKSHGRTVPANLDSMDKREASAFIDELKGLEANAMTAQEEANMSAEEPF